MSSISINEELDVISAVNTEETVRAKPISAGNSAAIATELPAEAELSNVTESRLYLAAMSHFFSRFSDVQNKQPYA